MVSDIGECFCVGFDLFNFVVEHPGAGKGHDNITFLDLVEIFDLLDIRLQAPEEFQVVCGDRVVHRIFLDVLVQLDLFAVVGKPEVPPGGYHVRRLAVR